MMKTSNSQQIDGEKAPTNPTNIPVSRSGSNGNISVIVEDDSLPADLNANNTGLSTSKGPPPPGGSSSSSSSSASSSSSSDEDEDYVIDDDDDDKDEDYVIDDDEDAKPVAQKTKEKMVAADKSIIRTLSSKTKKKPSIKKGTTLKSTDWNTDWNNTIRAEVKKLETNFDKIKPYLHDDYDAKKTKGYYTTKTGKFQAQITYKKKKETIGTYTSEAEAANAYRLAKSLIENGGALPQIPSEQSEKDGKEEDTDNEDLNGTNGAKTGDEVFDVTLHDVAEALPTLASVSKGAEGSTGCTDWNKNNSSLTTTTTVAATRSLFESLSSSNASQVPDKQSDNDNHTLSGNEADYDDDSIGGGNDGFSGITSDDEAEEVGGEDTKEDNLEEVHDASATTVATTGTVTTTTTGPSKFICMERDVHTFTLTLPVSVVKASTSPNTSDVTGDNVLTAFVRGTQNSIPPITLFPKKEDGDTFWYTINGGIRYTSQAFRGLLLKDILKGNSHTTIITLTIEDKADSSGGAKSKASKVEIWIPSRHRMEDNLEEVHDASTTTVATTGTVTTTNMDREVAMALRVSIAEMGRRPPFSAAPFWRPSRHRMRNGMQNSRRETRRNERSSQRSPWFFENTTLARTTEPVTTIQRANAKKDEEVITTNTTTAVAHEKTILAKIIILLKDLLEVEAFFNTLSIKWDEVLLLRFQEDVKIIECVNVCNIHEDHQDKINDYIHNIFVDQKEEVRKMIEKLFDDSIKKLHGTLCSIHQENDENILNTIIDEQVHTFAEWRDHFEHLNKNVDELLEKQNELQVRSIITNNQVMKTRYQPVMKSKQTEIDAKQTKIDALQTEIVELKQQLEAHANEGN